MTKRASVTAESGRSHLRSFLLVLGIVLLAANLRPALTGVAPLIGQIRADTGISNAVAGLLTTLPLLAFGLLSPIAPRVARRFGIERALLASLLVLASGILLRWAGAVAALFLGTAVLGAAIAVANVLLPSLVKREFPEHAGLMTSVYSTSLGISAALAAGLAGDTVYGVAVASVLRDADVASRDPTRRGNGGSQSGMDARAISGR